MIKALNLYYEKIFVLLIFLVLVLGCIAPPNPNTFKLGEKFSIKENQSFTEEKEKFTVKAVSFTDSRCPENVQCVWEGELGVNLLIVNKSGEQEIYLGTVTKLKETFFDVFYEIELISIDFESKTTELKITELPVQNKFWFSIEPVQCNENKWDNWAAASDMYFSTELDFIKAWIGIEQGIEVYEIESKREIYKTVCEDCSCPRGDKIAILVDAMSEEKMISLGWQKMSVIACTEDARLCPDESSVARIAPFCDFEKCPSGE